MEEELNKIQQQEEMTQEVESLLSETGSAGTTSNGHLDTIDEEEEDNYNEDEDDNGDEEENETGPLYNAKDIYRKVRIYLHMSRKR